MPIQRTIFTGSVKNSKTICGDASIKVSLLIGSPATPRPRFLFDFQFHLIQLQIPKAADQCAQAAETLRADPIESAGAAPSLGQQTRVSQNLQVLRDGRSRRFEMPGNFTGRQFVRANHSKNVDSTRLRERPQRCLRLLVPAPHKMKLHLTPGWFSSINTSGGI